MEGNLIELASHDRGKPSTAGYVYITDTPNINGTPYVEPPDIGWLRLSHVTLRVHLFRANASHIRAPELGSRKEY